MSRLYEALSRMKVEAPPLETTDNILRGNLKGLNGSEKRGTEFICEESVMMFAPRESRLVALTGCDTLGADKFRALVNRLTGLRKQKQLRSLQVTSSGEGEGKTFIAANLALTFALYARCTTLLIEGDLRRPGIASSFGLRSQAGLVDWWSGRGSDLGIAIRRIHGTSLRVLTAGTTCAQPSEILTSIRFKQAFTEISEKFDWVVVDSPPMSPAVDVNLWARLLDGTMLVVREGVTPLKRLKKSLATLDDPKLIGIVLNEVTQHEGASYWEGRYFN